MVNHRPMYQSFNGVYAIWFDGLLSSPDWMIGLSTVLDARKFTIGYAQSNRDTRCPDFRDVSTEWWENKWSSNTNIALTCIGKTLFK